MTGPAGPPDPHAERVLSQALNVMAGGGRPAGGSGPRDGRIDPDLRWSSAQVILLAALIGTFLGMVAGVTSLLA